MKKKENLYESLKEKAKLLGAKKERAIFEKTFWDQVSLMEGLKKYKKKSPSENEKRANEK